MDGIELKSSDVRKSRSIITASSFAFSAITFHFPQLLKCDTDMVASYHVVPLLATLLYLITYEQCSTCLLKMLHKHCNTDVFNYIISCPASYEEVLCFALYYYNTTTKEYL